MEGSERAAFAAERIRLVGRRVEAGQPRRRFMGSLGLLFGVGGGWVGGGQRGCCFLGFLVFLLGVGWWDMVGWCWIGL